MFNEHYSPRVCDFIKNNGMLSFGQLELRRRDGGLVNAYCFLHLTVQEFLAALRIMTSSDVSDADLKKR